MRGWVAARGGVAMVQEAGELEAMLPAYLREGLLATEKRLLSSAMQGYMTVGGTNAEENGPGNDPGKADAGSGRWGSEREVRAELIRWLCTDAKASKLIDVSGFTLFGARITGNLRLDHATLSFPLSMIRCRIAGCSLFHIKAPMLQFTGCSMDGMNATGAEVTGTVFLDRGFHCTGVVDLYGAKIDGDLNLAGARVEGADIAVDASEASVRGRVLLSGGFYCKGRVNLYGIQIGGDLDCRGGHLSHPGDVALDANTATIKGAVFFREHFMAEGELSLIGAQIAGDLNCEGGRFLNGSKRTLNALEATIGGAVRLFNGFLSVGEVSLYGAQIGGDLYCRDGHLSNPKGAALMADSVVIKGGVFLSRPFLADGLVSLVGAQVNLDLNCEGGVFDNEGSLALNLTQANIHGALLLTYEFSSHGSVIVYGAQIGGDLNCTGAHLSAPGESALVADGAVIKGGVFLTEGFTAEGEVRMIGLQITGDLDCNQGHFTNAAGVAIRADHLQLKGYVLLNKQFVAEGQVRLVGADIGRDLDCSQGHFKVKDGRALDLDSAVVGGSVLLRDGFSAEGGVVLLGVKVDGDLDCENGKFSDAKEEALNAERSEIKRAVFLRQGFSAVGTVNFQGAHIGSGMDCTRGRFDRLSLEEATIKQTLYLFELGGVGELDLEDATVGDIGADKSSWPGKDHLLLDGFVYGGVPDDLKQDGAWRLEWLKRPKDFAAQPYRQMAKMLRDLGDEDGAKEVLMELEGRSRLESRRKLGVVRRGRRAATDGISKATVGFGIYPELAAWELVGLATLGWIVYRRAQVAGAMAPTEKTAYEEFRKTGAAPAGYAPFQPLVYALENCVPLVKLGQDEKWQADPDATGRVGRAVAAGRWAGWRRRVLMLVPERVVSPGSLRWLRWAMILLGWVLATFFVAGLTGSIRTG